MTAEQFNFENWLQNGALIGKVGKWVDVHWGQPQLFSKESELTQTAVYKNNFYLENSKPWMQFPHRARWDWKTWRQMLSQYFKTLPPETPVVLQWEEPLKKDFEKVFKQIKKEMQSQTILKAVPVVSAKASRPASPSERSEGSRRTLLNGLLQAAKNTYLHGAWFGEAGFLGFTPEILFISEKAKKIKSMALAGTRQRDVYEQDPENFLRHPKELKEHEIVVQDILEQLSKVGKAKSAKTGILELNYLVHLYTALQVTLTEQQSFEQMVDLLHPTPALGISPRAEFEKLREWRQDSDFLGAPFGIRWSDTEFMCLVAIRNLRWDKTHYYIDNGCGVVAESQLDEEWKELKSKRDSVKKVFKI